MDNTRTPANPQSRRRAIIDIVDGKVHNVFPIAQTDQQRAEILEALRPLIDEAGSK